MDEFGPLDLRPHPGRQWAEHGGKGKNPDRETRSRRRAADNRPHGVRHLPAASSHVTNDTVAIDPFLRSSYDPIAAGS